jgi:hypothetical protein
VRGFGFLHDGSVDTGFRFMQAHFFDQVPLVNPGGFPLLFGDGQRRDVEAFMLAFDSNLFPIVGQQATLPGGSPARVDLLEARADAGECELIVRGDENEGYLYLGAGTYATNSASAPPLTSTALRAQATHGELTWTCVPPGDGRRMAVDHDLDGILDGDQ